jgi:hypothetical protein
MASLSCGTGVVILPSNQMTWPINKGVPLNIQKIIQSVTAANIKKAKVKVKAHFELGHGTISQMNMIAFD